MPRMRLIAVFILVLAVFAAPTFAQEASEEPEVTAEVTSEATEAPTSEATAETTPEATGEATSEVTETVTPSETPVSGGTYTVRPGDNLFRIALRNGLTTQQLAQANGIANPSIIYVGQVLVIPGADGTPTTVTPVTPGVTPEPDETTTYTVVPGDTLYRIAIRYGTTVAELVSLNTIANANLIFVGQVLTIPGTDEEEPTATETPDPEATEAPEVEVDMGIGVEVFVDDSQVFDALASQLVSLGVGWVKITMDWGAVEEVEGGMNFALYDDAISTFNGAELDVLVTLVGAPDWARTSATEYALSLDTFYSPPDNLAEFGEFAGEVAERYADQVAAYEIWTAPNLRRNWLNPAADLPEVAEGSTERPQPVNAGIAPIRYIDLLEEAYTAIKAADPDAVVLTAGLAPTGLNDSYNSIDNFVFFEELLRQGALAFSDGLGVQIDGFNNPPDAACCGTAEDGQEFNESYHFFFSDVLSSYDEILERNNGDEELLWVTHFGWGSAEGIGAAAPAGKGYLGDNTQEEQATFTVAALEQGDEAGYVAAMVLYNLNGCSALVDGEACFYSAVDSGGAARPVFNALQEFMAAQ